MNQIDFAKGMSLLSVAYQGFDNFKINEQTMEVWYSFFEDIRSDVFIAAVKSFIRSSQYPPKINELLQHCESSKQIIFNQTLKRMYDEGYFNKDVNDYQSNRNYEKANQWLQRGTEPQWLKDDMRKYYQLMVEDKRKEQFKIM